MGKEVEVEGRWRLRVEADEMGYMGQREYEANGERGLEGSTYLQRGLLRCLGAPGGCYLRLPSRVV